MDIKLFLLIWVCHLFIPLGCATVLAYFYSRAILLGIASARNEQHRTTPRSPWFFFDREFRPRERRIAFGLVLTLILGNVVPWFNLVAWYYEDMPLWSDGTWRAAAIILSAYLGAICIYFSGIILAAPRFRNPVALTAVGALPAICVWFLFASLMLSGRDDDGYLPLTILGVAAFCSVWHYARRTWFRFED